MGEWKREYAFARCTYLECQKRKNLCHPEIMLNEQMTVGLRDRHVKELEMMKDGTYELEQSLSMYTRALDERMKEVQQRDLEITRIAQMLTIFEP